MKTKLKSSIIAYHMAVGHRVAAAMVCALCAVGLSAFAEESVTINEVKSVQPWDKAKGTITVDYSLGGLDAAKEYKVAFDITANGVTKGVTNDATKLTDGAATKEIDTAKLFGKQVVDTKAKVKVSLIAVKASSEPEYVVMKMGTGEGAYSLKWATKNLGAEKEIYGYYFAWGDNEGYIRNGAQWVKASDGTTPLGDDGKFNSTNYNKTPGSALNTDISPTSGYDAARSNWGGSWRMPTSQEFQNLADACGGNNSYDKTTYASTACGKATTFTKGIYWCGNYDGVAGCLFCDGTNKLFFPAAGYGYGTSLSSAGSYGGYWSSSLTPGNTASADGLDFNSSSCNLPRSNYRYYGFSVRPVKEVK